jgi:hypothetical protein
MKMIERLQIMGKRLQYTNPKMLFNMQELIYQRGFRTPGSKGNA